MAEHHGVSAWRDELDLTRRGYQSAWTTGMSETVGRILFNWVGWTVTRVADELLHRSSGSLRNVARVPLLPGEIDLIDECEARLVGVG